MEFDPLGAISWRLECSRRARTNNKYFSPISANIRADVSGSGELTTDKKGRQIAQIKTVIVKLKIGDATGTATNTDGNRNNDVISEFISSFLSYTRNFIIATEPLRE